MTAELWGGGPYHPTHLKPLMELCRHRHDRTRGLDDVDGAARKPGPAQRSEEALTHDERADARREAEHLVKADRHRVHGRVRERDRGRRRERRGVEQRRVALRAREREQGQRVLRVGDVRLAGEREEAGGAASGPVVFQDRLRHMEEAGTNTQSAARPRE